MILQVYVHAKGVLRITPDSRLYVPRKFVAYHVELLFLKQIKTIKLNKYLPV